MTPFPGRMRGDVARAIGYEFTGRTAGAENLSCSGTIPFFSAAPPVTSDHSLIYADIRFRE